MSVEARRHWVFRGRNVIRGAVLVVLVRWFVYLRPVAGPSLA